MTAGVLPSGWVLCPRPHRLDALGAWLELPEHGAIALVGAVARELDTGRAVGRALARLGRRWGLTAAAGSGATVRLAIDPARIPHGEGYRLEIGAAGVELVARTPRGLAYGAATLDQLCAQATGPRLPCLAIEDAPALAERGLMLDISRDRVPTMETLVALVDRMAGLKLNQLQLYCEHTFAYRNHREVWECASPLTPEEVLTLGEHCRARHVDLVPCTNSLGHMERWLGHPRYRPLAECPDGFTDPWGHRRAVGSTLNPVDPRALALVAELWDEMLPQFSSALVNAGGDEPFELGQGRSAPECARRGRRRVYLDYLRGLGELAARHGKTMRVWGDVICEDPTLAADLPPGAGVLVWGYEAAHDFDTPCGRLAAADVPFVVCPGTSTWNALAGRPDAMLGSITRGATTARGRGALGLLTTDWGDNGHWQHPVFSWPGFALGAALGWNPDQAFDEAALVRALDRFVYADPTGQVATLVLALGRVSPLTGCSPPNASLLAKLLLEPERPLAHWLERGATAAGFGAAAERASALGREIDGLSTHGSPELAKTVRELRHTAAMLSHACALGTARLGIGGGPISELDGAVRQGLAADLTTLIAGQAERWRESSREGGLQDSLARLERVRAMYA